MHTGNQIHSEKIKNIFIDLDETLIHTNLTNGDMPNEIPGKTKNTVKKISWLVKVKKIPNTSELFIVIPPSTLKHVGWSEGDTILWTPNNNGYLLTKIEPKN